MATIDQDVSSVTPKWRRRRVVARYREFVIFGVLLVPIVILCITERLDPSDVGTHGFLFDTPSFDWVVLWTSAFFAELAVLYAAAKTLVYFVRDREHARRRARLTLGAALLLLLVFWALWPREHAYTSRGFNGYTGPPGLEFLVAESDAERQLKGLRPPDEGVDAWTVFNAFADKGGEPYASGFQEPETHAEFLLIRGGSAPSMCPCRSRTLHRTSSARPLSSSTEPARASFETKRLPSSYA